MKTKWAIIGILAVALLISSVSAAGNMIDVSGKHYNLNIIGVKDINKYPGPANDNTNNGNRIFVPLTGHADIWLQQSFTGVFNVIDYVANSDGAKFELPAPNNVIVDGAYQGPGDYLVYARVVGKPGGYMDMKTCAFDGATQVCSIGNTVTLSKNNKFSDVTKQLTTLCALGSNTGCVNIFDSRYQNYFWYYDNYGAKVLQLRFYPI